MSRRALLAGSSSLPLAITLAACNPSANRGSAAGQLSFAFWGPQFYQTFTQEMVDLFESAHQDVSVETQPSEWGAYWDKLATQVAGGDAPDVINMDGKYIADYSQRSVLADLESLDGLDLSTIADADLDAGRIDGTLTGLSTGSNAWVLVANKPLLEEAGIDLPDDTTWTWDDFSQLATTISDSATALGFSGGGSYADLTIYLRQRGEDLWASAAVGGSTESIAQWLTLYKDLQDAGASLSASAAEEDGSVSLEQQAFSTGKTALTWTWTNQLQAVRDAAGTDEVVMLRPPSLAGKATENGLFKKATMYWSIAKSSSTIDQAAQLVDFLVNDAGAQKIQLLNRGVPLSESAITTMTDDLAATDTDVVTFLNAVTPEITGSPATQPMGTADAQNAITRALSSVRFGDADPATAATSLISDLEGMISA